MKNSLKYGSFALISIDFPHIFWYTMYRIENYYIKEVEKLSTRFSLSKEGFVVNYLTTGAVTEPFVAPHTNKNQLKFEAEMRAILPQKVIDAPAPGALGEKSQLGAEWKFYAQNRNTYIDFSKFYFTLTRVNLLAQTQLVSDSAKQVRARIWSYATIDLWLNGAHTANISNPVYKPISHTDVTLALREGVNDIFVCLQNFGVRDTRNMFALQLFDTEGISVTLPVEEDTLSALKAAEDWLCSVVWQGGSLRADGQPPVSVTVTADGAETVWDTGSSYSMPDAKLVTLSFTVCGQPFARKFDLVQNDPPVFVSYQSDKEKFDTLMRHAAESSTQGHMAGYKVLARYYLNNALDEYDYQLLDEVIEKIEQRIDCSDFGLACLLRIYKQIPIKEEYKKKIKTLALGFRYWMDEDGADAMCFWSENHSLLFFTCQMLAGSFWPEDWFERSSRFGVDQYGIGLRRVKEWFDIIEQEGFEEFLAGGYMLVTLSVLLMVHDFGDPQLSARAKNAIDRIVLEAAQQNFQGIHLAPMGRIYRDSLKPYKSGLQALLHRIDDSCATQDSIWLTVLGYTPYKMPPQAKELLCAPTDISFTSGRALIFTKKTDDYMLTSVASPRLTPITPLRDTTTEYYATKLDNEWFHGTSLFVPGEYGYQQHLWYAAISNRCLAFVNHPGTEKDFCEMRPGYWYGNGVFPALRQDGNALYCYYAIPDAHPTKFVHLYWPSFAMEEEVKKDGFFFARCGSGYLGVWCSEPLALNNADAVMDADWRAYGDDSAWYIQCGSESEFGSFAAFIEHCRSLGLTKARVKEHLGV